MPNCSQPKVLFPAVYRRAAPPLTSTGLPLAAPNRKGADMRTYTSMTAGAAAKLLVTDAGTTRTIATIADHDTATALAKELTGLAAVILIDAANPDLPAALRTLGVRQNEVQTGGQLLLSALAHQPAPSFANGTSWRSTGITTVWHLAHVLHYTDTLPAGPARSVRNELATLLGLADGPVVTATVTADGYEQRSLTWVVTSWLSSATDDEVEAVIGDDFEGGYGTDEISYAYEAITASYMGSGFSVRVDAVAARQWLHKHRPALLASS